MTGPVPGTPDAQTPGAQTADVRIRAEAAAWLARMQGAADPTTRRGLAAWLDADPRHAAAWSTVNAAWALAGLGSETLLREEAPKLAPLMARVRAARRRRALRRGTVLLLLLAIGGGWVGFLHPNALQNLGADAVSARGERRSIPLPDGSTALLDADSAIALDFGGARRVRLLRGAAHFDVRRDGRPFIVTAGAGEVQVTGTAFDVVLAGEAASVTLERGAVRVMAGGQAPVVLAPGEQVGYAPGRIGTPQAVDLETAQAWQAEWYVFDDIPLAEVLARLERERSGRIVVIGSSLAGRRISGSFPLADPEQALASLANTMGFRVRRLGAALTLVGP